MIRGTTPDQRVRDASLRGSCYVINCLVGPKGQGFDDKEANPCKDQGTGAFPDTTDEARRTALIQALAKANEGLRQTDFAAAHKSASEAPCC